MQYTNKYLISRLLREYARPLLPKIMLAIFFMVIYAAASSSQALMFEYIFDDVFSQKNTYYIRMLPVAIIVLFTIQGFANFFANYLSEVISCTIHGRMQKNLFKHFINFDLETYSRGHTGDFTSRIINDLSYISSFCNVMIAFTKNGFTMMGMIAVMLYQSWELTIISFSLMIFGFYPIFRIAKRLRKLSRQTQQQSVVLISGLHENFAGIKQIKAFQKEQYESERVDNIVNQYFWLALKGKRIAGLSSPIMSILFGFTIAMMIWYATGAFSNTTLTPGELVSFTAALMMLSRPVRSMTGLNHAIQNALAASERYFSMLDAQPEIRDMREAKELKIRTGKISFKDVSFSYEEGTSVLKNVNFSVDKNQKLALVGASGGGKSTIFSLLLRFYDYDSGSIEIDGQNIKKVSIKSLRKNISLVTQDVFLFADTVRANIAYGREGASEAEIIKAAKDAAAHDFIMDLPDGYNTQIGQFGATISGGQKQRIAIARAFLRNSPILLLDEATSSLDQESERDIKKALAKLTQGKTTLVIAHKLSSVIDADIICVMKYGKVAAKGTHKELSKSSHIYKELFGNL